MNHILDQWRSVVAARGDAETFSDRIGRCYELAGRYVMEHHSAKLVHGSIQGFDNPRIGHAWVILPSGEWYDTILDLALPESAFIDYFNAEVDATFSMIELAENSVRTGHWGPWDTGSIQTQAVNLGIQVQEISTGSNGTSGVVSQSQGAVLGWRGFGSWEEIIKAQQSGTYRSTGTFTVDSHEGRTQFATTALDVLKGSGFHQLRGTGFLGMVAIDLRGLPFRTLSGPGPSRFQPGRYGPNSWIVDKANPTSGRFFPDQGGGIGIDVPIPWDRVRFIAEIESGQVGRQWSPEDFDPSQVSDNPDWLPETTSDWTTTRLWTYRTGKGMVHVNALQTDMAWCGAQRLGEQSYQRTPIRWLVGGDKNNPPTALRQEGRVKIKMCPKCLNIIGWNPISVNQARQREEQYEADQRKRRQEQMARWGSFR